jgi:hypothetical protein
MIIEEAIVSGRSGSWSAESGIALLLSAGVPGLDPELDGTGDVCGCILQWCCKIELGRKKVTAGLARLRFVKTRAPWKVQTCDNGWTTHSCLKFFSERIYVDYILCYINYALPLYLQLL